MSRAIHGGDAGACQERLRDAIFTSPSIFGRLVAISQLQGKKSGIYFHPLSSTFGQLVVDRLLRRLHREVFATWLNLALKALTAPRF